MNNPFLQIYSCEKLLLNGKQKYKNEHCGTETLMVENKAFYLQQP